MTSVNKPEATIKFDAQQKHEEIKKKAWEAMLITCTYHKRKKTWSFAGNKQAWELAERFYNFAKEKEQEANDEI